MATVSLSWTSGWPGWLIFLVNFLVLILLPLAFILAWKITRAVYGRILFTGTLGTLGFCIVPVAQWYISQDADSWIITPFWIIGYALLVVHSMLLALAMVWLQSVIEGDPIQSHRWLVIWLWSIACGITYTGVGCIIDVIRHVASKPQSKTQHPEQPKGF